MKKFLSVCLILILAFSLTACNNSKPGTPQNVTVDDNGLITWDAVDGAVSYIVIINGNTNYDITKETSYQVSSVVNDFTYSIQAVDEHNVRSNPSPTATFKGKGAPIVPPPKPVEDVEISIAGVKDIHSGGTLQLSALVSGSTNTAVTWEVVKGADVITISDSGLITAKEVASNTTVQVKATSVANPSKSKTQQLNVIVKPILTQAMLDKLQGNRLSSVGFIDIDSYSIGSISKLERQDTIEISTIMDGDRWYAEYVNSLGTTSSLYCRKHNGYASNVNLNFLNEESYEPMKNDDGSELLWEDGGYYNCFNGLTMADFSFDEESWQWYYSGLDKSVPAKMMASLNPYDFKENGFSLMIDGDNIVGITAVSLDDYGVIAGYRCIQKLTTAVTVYADDDANFEIPVVERYVEEDIHAPLKTAITNMQNLTSYTADVFITGYTIYTPDIPFTDGYMEYVTSDLCYFEPFDYDTKTYIESQSYGYVKGEGDNYNSFHNDGTGHYKPSRAFTDGFANAKPSFQFAAPIFCKYDNQQDDGSIIYQVDASMAAVATTLYKGVGTDIAMHGVFASDTFSVFDIKVDATYVVVKDGYITDAVFYFDEYLMYGSVLIHFDDFNTATIPDNVVAGLQDYTHKALPTQWSELETYTDEVDESGNTVMISVDKYLQNLFGDKEVPFFGNALGDTYALVGDALQYSGDGKAHLAAAFFYDVPLELDYTVNKSIQRVNEYLISLGFEKNIYGEYYKDGLYISAVDKDMELYIYVWTNYNVE